MIGEVERFGEYPSWERGGVGQCLFHILVPDLGVVDRARSAVEVAVGRGDLDTAVRLLILHQYLADDSRAAVHETIEAHPALAAHWFADELVAIIDEHGWAPVY